MVIRTGPSTKPNEQSYSSQSCRIRKLGSSYLVILYSFLQMVRWLVDEKQYALAPGLSDSIASTGNLEVSDIIDSADLGRCFSGSTQVTSTTVASGEPSKQPQKQDIWIYSNGRKIRDVL